jgi:Family of unknown function (DUF6325)
MREPPHAGIATDLVEYLVLVVPGPDALATIGPELVRVVDSSAIRILDMVVVVVGEDGQADVIEADSVETLGVLRNASPCVGALLSRHDIELVSMALEPDSAAIIVVVEDRWAEPLSAAARAAGGEVRAGERIGRQRVETALTRAIDVEEEP